MNKGERIKKIRTEKGFSQTELANLAGISKQNLYKYENSIITNIPSDKIETIARLCDTTPAYIMGWEDNPDTEPLTTLPRQTGEHLSLSPTQQKIISNCKQLNETGQQKVLDFSDDLVSTEKYKPIGREPGYRIAAYGATETEEDYQPPIEEITT